MIDAQNKIWHHITIAVLSCLFVYILHLSEVRITRVTGIISFVLLFLVMLIGPVMKIWPSFYNKLPGEFPYTWRAELGIWFAVWSVTHFLFLLSNKGWNFIGYVSGMSPWGIGSLIAVFMAVILACTSFRGAIDYLGPKQWKWLQNYFTYVIWWLLVLHIIWVFIRAGFPPTEWLHWAYLGMVIIIPLLQLGGFIKNVVEYRKKTKQEEQIKE